MPQSLVNEFFDRRQQGDKLGTALKKAIFQAKTTIGYIPDDEERAKRFKLFKVEMRGRMDDDPIDWWFASTAVPILAATFGPLANVISIGALATAWRLDLVDPRDPNGDLLTQLQGSPIQDPKWCYLINVLSLVLGFAGNFVILLNFGNRIRYIFAVPITIILWCLACGLLIGDMVAMNLHQRPDFPSQMYSGGYWYACAAAVLYLILAAGLISNILGYIRGHYCQHFELSHDQKTLIVQTMCYFIWLAGGAAVYSKIEGWSFIDSVYFACVTLLTVGYGDMYPITTVGRALIIPYSFGGILILGLVITSIYKSVEEMGEKNIMRHHYEQQVENIAGRTVTTSIELERREIERELAKERAHAKAAARPSARSPSSASLMMHRQTTFEILQHTSRLGTSQAGSISTSRPGSIRSVMTRQSTMRSIHKQSTILLLREEKERFEAMRGIQKRSEIWKRWWRMSITFALFGVFWCIGALVFWGTERSTQGMTYFDAVYYCWITLTTIGYGDLSPKSVSGRCFFVIWVQFAVPAITILAQHLTSTVVAILKTATSAVATVFLRHNFTLNHIIYKVPWFFSCLPDWMQRRIENREAERTPSNGVAIGDETAVSFSKSFSRDEAYAAGTKEPNISELADQREKDVTGKGPDAGALARQLALAIRRASRDNIKDPEKQYSFEEWVEFIRLIRFSAVDGAKPAAPKDEDEGMTEWDWLAENSPMMSEKGEAEFVLERLCESLVRYLRRNPPHETFESNLREVGESALRLKVNADLQQDDGPSPRVEDAVQAPPAAQANGGGLATPAPSIFRTVDFSLHPVKEEDHDTRAAKKADEIGTA